MHIEKENVLYLWDKPDDVKRENVFIKRERERNELSRALHEKEEEDVILPAPIAGTAAS